MLFCSFRRKPKILTGGMFWWLSPFCEAVTSHHPPRWAPLPWPHSLSSHASQVLLPRTLFSQGGCCPIHGMLLQGPALFLQNKDHHLEHCTLALLLFRCCQCLSSPLDGSSTRTERTISLTSLHPVPCLWHILERCSVKAARVDDATSFINHAGINHLKLALRASLPYLLDLPSPP